MLLTDPCELVNADLAGVMAARCGSVLARHRLGIRVIMSFGGGGFPTHPPQHTLNPVIEKSGLIVGINIDVH